MGLCKYAKYNKFSLVWMLLHVFTVLYSSICAYQRLVCVYYLACTSIESQAIWKRPMAPVSLRIDFSVFSSIISLISALACLTTCSVGPSMSRYSFVSSSGTVWLGA